MTNNEKQQQLLLGANSEINPYTEENPFTSGGDFNLIVADALREAKKYGEGPIWVQVDDFIIILDPKSNEVLLVDIHYTNIVAFTRITELLMAQMNEALTSEDKEYANQISFLILEFISKAQEMNLSPIVIRHLLAVRVLNPKK